MPFEWDDDMPYYLSVGWDGLRDIERVRLAAALRDAEKSKAKMYLREEVKRLGRRGYTPKRIARWLCLPIETVEEHLAA